MSLFKRIKEQKKAMAFDYETSGLRPFYPGHIIVSASVAMWGEDEAYSWPYSYPGSWDSKQLEAIRVGWGEILADPHIPKIAQNIQMERPWSKLIIGVDPQGWCLDTMVCSHVIDERPAFTGLDFQVFINWGYEYGEEISKYKSTVPGTKFNTMHKCPLNLLLPYGGLDAYFTIRLAEKQWNFPGLELSDLRPTQRAYDLFHDGVLAFSEMEEEGIPVDVKYYQDTSVKLEKRISFIEKQLLRTPEALLFKSKEGRDIKLNSPDDLKKLLFQYLGIPSTKKTILDNDSVDKDVLDSIDLPFAKDLVKKRKLDKLKATYLDGILDIQVYGRIHPNFNLHLVRTYRSSSSQPNFQNLPKRDKESMSMIRGGIIPSLGNLLIEADYGGHEIGILACYSKDPILMKERRDGKDIHQEWADFLGVSRFDGKNGFSFALIYGSYFKNIHTDLVGRGYRDLSLMKVQKAEQEFWRKYKWVKKFQEELIESYKRNGYVEMFHGFRRRGFLTRNEIINSVIQGSAFHCLLESIIKINLISKEEGWKSKLMGQIHDSIIIDCYHDELDHVVEIVKRAMTKDILINNPWIVVPLISDIKIGKINQSWSYF
jgi:DNA polymerase-1